MSGSIGIINGTGGVDYDDSKYDDLMRDSFCTQMSRSTSPDIREVCYIRGPGGDGFTTVRRATQVFNWAKGQYARYPDSPVYLAGYSRGAWGVTMVAEWLKAEGKRVKAMFLFDPVRMQTNGAGKVVPSNVDAVYIARRMPNAPEMDKYDWHTSMLNASMNPVRKWWGTTADKNNVPGWEKPFLGSHGALGGVGWRLVEEDKKCQPAVADFMNRAFLNEKLSIHIDSLSFPSEFDGIQDTIDSAKTSVRTKFNSVFGN